MSLSDKYYDKVEDLTGQEKWYFEEDIKKAIKELKDECLDIWVASKNKTEAIDSIIERINKIFGKGLVE